MSDRPRVPKALRELVFSRSGGVCQSCGAKITPDTFHAAHRRAHANGGVLEASNLEAWCAPCNLSNGSRDAADPRLQPRAWQRQALEPVTRAVVETGSGTVSAAPGAGKTVFAGLVFEALREIGFVDRMVVLVPRRALVEQWAGSLARHRHLQLKPHSAIERRGQCGAVVTYQSLGNADALEVHRQQAEFHRTLLVLDEVHHVGERPGGMVPGWAQNVCELAGDVEGHKLGVAGVLNLSGTMWRSDARERISTLRYRRLDDDRLESLVDYGVTVEELVASGELRPIDLYRLNAEVRVADYRNLEHLEGNLGDLDEEPARAVMRSLGSASGWREAFVDAVLTRLERAHRDLDGYHAKALIVASRQSDARAFQEEVDRQMRERGLRPLASLAISDEPAAGRTLEHFRQQRRPGVLCTVDMAGEGYDCPEIAVIGYASNKLTAMYVRQVTARAMRVTQRERDLGRVIPAAVVCPDAPELVEKLVSYLAPYTYEVLVPSLEELADMRARTLDEPRGSEGSMPRFVLENAYLGADQVVTVPYPDGSREDVDADLCASLAAELERLNTPGIYAPRVLAASRRTVGTLLDTRPFDQPSRDLAVLDRLVEGKQGADGDPASVTAFSSVEEQAGMLQRRLHKLAQWWSQHGDSPGPDVSPAAYFNSAVNSTAGIGSGQRPSASISQLERALQAGERMVVDYCDRTGTNPPSWWERGDS